MVSCVLFNMTFTLNHQIGYAHFNVHPITYHQTLIPTPNLGSIKLEHFFFMTEH
jgi:hypothetical protein